MNCYYKLFNSKIVKYKLIKWKFKVILFIIIFIFYYFYSNFFAYLLPTNNFLSNNDLQSYINYYSAFEPLNSKISLLPKFKKLIHKMILKKNVNKNIRNVNSIYVDVDFRFGNLMAFLNKLLYYCEIVKCKFVILNEKKFWFINRKVNIKYKNITIKKGNNIYYNESCVLRKKPWKIYFSSFYNIKTPIRIYLLKNQIINNLPKIISSREELYIHIRSGNIFKNYFHSLYSQPPFCFYEKVLKSFKFKKVVIIAKDTFNPIVKKLINKFPTIKYAKKSLKIDIASLINAFNIICSISSFLVAILQLNANFEFLWEYNIYKISEKQLHFHFDFNKFPHNNFTIFRMEPSFVYKKKMFRWKHTKSQLKLMIKEKCVNDFYIIKKEIN